MSLPDLEPWIAHMLLIVTSLLAVIAYSCAGYWQGCALLNRPQASKALVLSLAALGAVSQAILLSQGMLTPEGWLLDFVSLSSLMAIVLVSLVVVSSLTRPLENLLVIILPVAILTLALEWLLPQHGSAKHYHPGVLIHILASMLAYALLALAGIQALLLARQDWQLKHHHPSGIVKSLPPLQTMEKLLFELVWGGMVLLTLGLLTGFIFVENLFAQHLVHKTLLSLLAWVLFAILLWGHHRLGWRSRTAVRWTLGGFILLMLGFFGSKWVLEFVLGSA
ncbi:cytochrome C assembly family protein [Balneatrix alpica]|uniref:Inner membrane protein YpjD n=1 Tax=Balneatrix alpica TaxID=75684 RepID=A0ABV5Z9K4_9GAMM|nr:cytochrome c biogenesis protein CcsA [Balneatrix alpica]